MKQGPRISERVRRDEGVVMNALQRGLLAGLLVELPSVPWPSGTGLAQLRSRAPGTGIA